MSRRRIFWITTPIVLIGIAIAVWYVLARRDADFVTVGPKTQGVRDNFVKLDMMVDPADFRDCKTMRDAVARLIAKTRPPDFVEDKERHVRLWWPRHDWIRIDDVAFVEKRQFGNDLLASPFTLPPGNEPMTVKQFLRMTLAQSGVPDVTFVVRGSYVEATTASRAQEERTRYLDSVSLYDRMQSLWKEVTGNLDPDPPEVELLFSY